MIVVVVLEQRFTVDAAGGFWTADAFSRPFWERYLSAFDEVRVLARAEPAEPTPEMLRVDGNGVTGVPAPIYVGPSAFVRGYFQVRRAVRNSLAGADAVILRTPGALVNTAFRVADRMGIPLGTEVVGDPDAVFAPGVFSHPLRPVFRFMFSRAVRRQCAHGTVAAYVTEEVLQQKYPPGPSTFSTHYSSVELPEEAFEAPELVCRTRQDRSCFRLVTVASLDSMYKGVDVLLSALAASRHREQLRVDVIGDGRYRDFLVQTAASSGLADSISFIGRVPGPAAVRELMRGADLFVLASRTEGLPRALIEAMALGLPCLATAVGGIPELLDAADLVRPASSAALASAIDDVLVDPLRRREMGIRNLRRARDFHVDSIASRRADAYRQLATVAARSAKH